MPLYEYLCNDCHKEFEFLVHGNVQARCEKCGSIKLTKLLSVAAAHSGSSGQSGIPPYCQDGPQCCQEGGMPGGMCGMGGCGMSGS